MRKIEKVASALGALSLSKSLITDAREFYENKFIFTASLDEDAYCYEPTLEWLNNVAQTRRIHFNSTYSRVSRFHNSDTLSTIDMEGHKIQFRLSVPTPTEGYRDGPSGSSFNKKIVFLSKTRAGIDAVERKLLELTEKRKTAIKEPNYYSISQYGWEAITPSRRGMDSVFLAGNSKQELLDDLDIFFSAEDKFVHIGLPWHRGYLFYGPPGNGKSSVAKAVVDKYRLNMYNLQLSAVTNDQKLSQLVSNLSPRSVLLLEDVDIFSKTMKREQSENGPTLAGLLNCLDGVSTPHGLVTIMTTNHPDLLDDALTRPGRVDKKVFLGTPERTQVTDMYEWVYDEPLGFEPKSFDSMASLTEVFKANPYDAEQARVLIKEEK